MDKKILYTYDDNGDIQEYNAYIKIKILSGFQVYDNLNNREEMIKHLENSYIRSKIYPTSLLYSKKELLKDRLYFERKDICQTLKGNSAIQKFDSPLKIITFLKLIEDKVIDYFSQIKEYNPRLLECIKKTVDFTYTIVKHDFTPLLIELGDFVINLKNMCVYLIEDVVDGLTDIIVTIKQLKTTFLYNTDRSILILINDLNEIEKMMKETEIAIMFKQIQSEYYHPDNIDSKLEKILELPEDQIYKELQEYIKDEIENEKEMAIECKRKENIDDTEVDPNIILICEDLNSPKLSIKKTVEFLEDELKKINNLLQQSNI